MGYEGNRNNKEIKAEFHEGWTEGSFLFSYLPLPSEEVLASSLGLAHLDVCVFECGRVREPDGEEGCSTSNKERTGE